MRAFHDSRDVRYRSPYGAVTPKTTVILALDVWDAPDAVVTLRTWDDVNGERLICADAEQCGDRVRHTARMTPEQAGIVWYHFIVALPDGSTKRFGAQDGRRGGEGLLRDWEPPSFQLSVFEENITPPAWYEPISGYFYDSGAERGLAEMAQTLCENYPKDAFRSIFPWGQDDWGDNLVERTSIGAAQPTLPFASGTFSWFSLTDDVFGFGRSDKPGEAACVIMNASASEWRDVEFPLLGEAVDELIGGYEVALETPSAAMRLPDGLPKFARSVRLHLGPAGCAVLFFHPANMLAKPMEPGVGVLAHITSLPNGEGVAGSARPGTLGAPARSFVDWLAKAGMRYWQVLPVNPTDEHGSPYAGISAFAGNARLLEVDSPAEGLVKPAESDEYRAFCERERAWLEPYSAFVAIRRKMGPGLAWQDWPEPYRRFDPAVIKAEDDLRMYAEECRCEQFAFERQWMALRAYANERGVRIIGDMPIYVSTDSADVWAHPEIFQLDEAGRPGVVSGCPPDAFAADGQVWGNPVYDWDACKADGYSWWFDRLNRAFSLYDVVRLDHFIGFARYYSIPVGKKAVEGTYRPGPGIDFFAKAFKRFGALPVIAEDLGLITPGVRGLVAACGFLGMDIIQFVDGNDPLGGYRPRPGKIAYTGTHDNQTLVGYVQARYPDVDAHEAAAKLVDAVLTCGAAVRIVALQDVLGLGDETRMNTPGTTEGNWIWQADSLC